MMTVFDALVFSLKATIPNVICTIASAGKLPPMSSGLTLPLSESVGILHQNLVLFLQAMLQ